MDAWNYLCLPAKIYILVMIPIILFDIYLGSTQYAISNSISLCIGAILLWTLCAAKLEFVAYVLMFLPVLFFVFLIALIFYDKSLLSVRHEYTKARLEKQRREQMEANQYENDIIFNDNAQCEDTNTQCKEETQCSNPPIATPPIATSPIGNPQCGNPQCNNPQCNHPPIANPQIDHPQHQCDNPQCGNPQCSNAQPSAPKTCGA
jgi:hypothetical protein